jgi:poly-gamma-glutamate synthesis protein (capsule biosynthesis protein)
MRRTPKILFVTILPAVVIAGLLLLMQPFNASSHKTGISGAVSEADSVTFWVTGDAMMHLPMYKAALNEATGIAEFDSCYTFIRSILNNADIRLVNFETTLAGEPYTGYPKFSAPTSFADALRRAGFNFFVFANNHAADRASEGIEGNIRYAESVKLWSTGIFRNQKERDERFPFMLEIKGWKLAILNYTYSTNGIPVPEPYIVNKIDTVQMLADINKAKANKADAILVSIHWGEEYQHKPNANQRAIADFLVRQNVDVIIGSHPHVVQPVEMVTPIGSLSSKLIIWSLGNFISNQKDTLTDAGLLVGFTLKKSRHGTTEVCHVKYIPLYRYKHGRLPGYYMMPGMLTEKKLEHFIPDATDQADFKGVMTNTRDKMGISDWIREVAQ